ncbi:MAG: hypothetical protein ABIR15_18630 [Chitinophagaceae bacterium]
MAANKQGNPPVAPEDSGTNKTTPEIANDPAQMIPSIPADDHSAVIAITDYDNSLNALLQKK